MFTSRKTLSKCLLNKYMNRKMQKTSWYSKKKNTRNERTRINQDRKCMAFVHKHGYFKLGS